MYYLFKELFIYSNQTPIEEIKSNDDENCVKFLLLIKGWNELHYTYLSTICEYISQMTDDYAIKEYQELYLD